MEICPGKLEGVYIIKLKPFEDERGFFIRTFDRDIFNRSNINPNWVQENHSRSTRKGTVRGLHFQFPPFAETKLVRCIRGSILDILVDLRKGSATFGEWVSIVLSDKNFCAVVIPKGFAHGFCTLTDGSEVTYKVDNYYSPDHESGLLWNDPDLAIEWPIDGEPVLSEKDKENMTLREFIEMYGGISI